MKKLYSVMIFAVFCLTMSHAVLAMRTGQTRREALQARHIALKQARKAMQLNIQSNCTKPKPWSARNPYTIFGECYPQEPAERATSEIPYCKYLRFTGSCSKRFLFLTMIASLLMPVAHGATLDIDKLQTTREAVVLGQTIAKGCPKVITGIQATIQAVQSIKFDGALNGQLGGAADNFGHLIHMYHENEATDPVKTRAALSAAMVAASGAIGFITGALATLPEGGVGAIPCMIEGLSIGGDAEIVGTIIGEAIHQADKLIDHKVESWIQHAIQKGAPIFILLDHQLTNEQALNWVEMASLAGVTSTHFTAVINSLGHMELSAFRTQLNSIRGLEQAPLKNLRQNIIEQLMRPLHKEDIEHGLSHKMRTVFMDGVAHKPEANIVSLHPLETQPLLAQHPFAPEKSFMQEKVDFMGTAKGILDHQAYERWKADSSDVLQLPRTNGLDFIKQQHYEMMSRPDWNLEGAAGNAWYQEQQQRRKARL